MAKGMTIGRATSGRETASSEPGGQCHCRREHIGVTAAGPPFRKG
ncbi:hypothetical protein ES703_46629 [subsurface metagenome]|jgi:hypothetical protein